MTCTTTPDGRDLAGRPSFARMASDTDFVGREHELSVLDAVLDQVRALGARVVLVQGAAGIGKTALVRRFLARHADLRTVWSSGEEGEASVSYTLVDQLLGAVGLRTPTLLAHTERVLPVEEPIVVGRQILDVLTRLSASRPVAAVVDDAHLADVDSLRALLFALRRLDRSPVLTVLVVPTEGVRLPAGLTRLADGATGAVLPVEPLVAADVQALAAGTGTDLPALIAHRLCAHTLGNPRHVKALLAEVPTHRWWCWEPVLPAPRAFDRAVGDKLEACSEDARRLVQAAATLGHCPGLSTVTALADVDDPLVALDEACASGLLEAPGTSTLQRLEFPHPLVRAAVYGQLPPARRMRLHLAAARLVEDEDIALHHRAAASVPPDERLAGELEAYAARARATADCREAVWALIEAGRLSASCVKREQRLLLAVNLVGDSGGAAVAQATAHELGADAGPLRDATAAYLALLKGRAGQAQTLLHEAWAQCTTAGRSPADRGSQAVSVAAVTAQWSALHAVGQLRSVEVVEWARRALELAGPDDPVRVEAQALLGLGLGWRRSTPTPHCPRTADDALLVRAGGVLALDVDDALAARTVLAQTAPAALRAGSVWFAVWSYVWLAWAGVAVGAWDEAAADAERAVSLLEESGHEWLRPLARCAAVLVPAARGDWVAAGEHAAAAVAGPGDYELMVVAAGVAGAVVGAARADFVAVLRALEPVVRLGERAGVDEPGFWPWQDLYAEALVSAGRLGEAEEFLVPHEELAAVRGRGSMVARLARVRGRLEAARGRWGAAEAAFGRAGVALGGLPLPFQWALLDLAHGQVLRRAGQRRAAAERLSAARERLVGLRARPYVERCEVELAACGLAPAKRGVFDPSRLTAQELAVARLVAVGMSNRRVASELFISIKTVQFHLTHIYSKLGVRSRAELAAQFRDPTATDEGGDGPADGR
jgi:DNA-binding CsgD family transcriptional regulator